MGRTMTEGKAKFTGTRNSKLLFLLNYCYCGWRHDNQRYVEWTSLVVFLRQICMKMWARIWHPFTIGHKLRTFGIVTNLKQFEALLKVVFKFSFLRFCPWKGLITHVAKKVWLSNSFFCVCLATSQDWFLARPPVWTAIEVVKFHWFCSVRCSYIAHGMLSGYKLQDAFIQFTQSMETSTEIFFNPVWFG